LQILLINGKICRCGGIGRHDRLKICFSSESVGSSPTIGTTFILTMYTIADIILAEINWFYFIGPIVVYIFLEINSDGGNGFDGFG
jgi:hypothetical protein